MKPQDFQKIVQAARDVNVWKEQDRRIIHNFTEKSTEQVDIEGCLFGIKGELLDEEDCVVEHGVFWPDLVERIVIRKHETDTFKIYDYHTIDRDELPETDSFAKSKEFFEAMRVQVPTQWQSLIKVI